MGKTLGRRRVAGEGEDDQEIPRARATRSSPPRGTSRICPRSSGIDVENGFKETYEVIAGKEKVVAGAEGAPPRTPTRSCSPPTPIAKAKPSPGTSPRSSRRRSDASASSSTRSRRRASSTASPPARAQQAPLRRAACAARARPHRRLRRLGARLVASSRSGSQRRARAERRAAAHRRPRARDRGVRPRGVLELRRRARHGRRGATRSTFFARLASARTARSSPSRTATRPRVVRRRSRDARRTASRRSRRASASATRPRRTRRASSSKTP